MNSSSYGSLPSWFRLRYGHGCRPSEIADPIENVTSHQCLPLLTLDVLRAQVSPEHRFVPREGVLDMGLGVIAGCSPPLTDALGLDGGEMLIALCRCAPGGL